MEEECTAFLTENGYCSIRFTFKRTPPYFDVYEGEMPADSYKTGTIVASKEDEAYAASFDLNASHGLHYTESYCLMKMLARLLVDIDISNVCERNSSIRSYIKGNELLLQNSDVEFEIVKDWLIIPIVYNEKNITLKLYADKLTSTQTGFDNMEGHKFEYFCADLLNRNGFKDVYITQGSGDQGIGIVAYKDEIKYGIQCKCYSSDVGNNAVQEVFAGKTFYGCHIGVVLTNQFFTKSAKELAKKNGVLLWDRRKLLELSENAKNSTL